MTTNLNLKRMSAIPGVSAMRWTDTRNLRFPLPHCPTIFFFPQTPPCTLVLNCPHFNEVFATPAHQHDSGPDVGSVTSFFPSPVLTVTVYYMVRFFESRTPPKK